ncbi:hypothetical protein BASA60_010829 [Batrachochytrium salamandrivorans]|nr:hypothetical protein BASA60_010829 [Batrachochytrium salamandrivorans]
MISKKLQSRDEELQITERQMYDVQGTQMFTKLILCDERTDIISVSMVQHPALDCQRIQRALRPSMRYYCTMEQLSFLDSSLALSTTLRYGATLYSLSPQRCSVMNV